MILVFKKRFFFLSLLSCLISACGGDGDSVSPPETNPSPPTTSAPIAPDSAAPSEKAEPVAPVASEDPVTPPGAPTNPATTPTIPATSPSAPTAPSKSPVTPTSPTTLPITPGSSTNIPAPTPVSPNHQSHHWTPAEVKALGPEELHKGGLRALTDDQISDVLELLTPGQLAIVDPAYARGLTHPNRESINKNIEVVKHLNAEFIQELFPEMTETYLFSLNADKIKELLKSDADLDNLKARAISTHFDFLWKEAFQAFPLEKMPLVLGDLKRCGTVRGTILSCIYYLTPEQIVTMGDKGLRYLEAKQIQKLGLFNNQLQVQAITGKQLGWLTPELAAAFKNYQIPWLSPDAIAQIPVVCNGGKDCEDGSFKNLFTDIRPWTRKQLEAVTLEQWKSLDPGTIQTLQARLDIKKMLNVD